MFQKIKNFILKIKCRKIYKQLPEAIKFQLYLEMNLPENANATYNNILEKRLELRKEIEK